MAKITDIGKARLTRRKPKGYCRHLNMTYCQETQVVQCDDCGEYLSHFTALMILVDELGRDHERREKQIKELRELQEKTLHLRAAKKVESAWRSRRTVPTCPHCREAIFPEDGLGSACIGKEIAAKKRSRGKGGS